MMDSDTNFPSFNLWDLVELQRFRQVTGEFNYTYDNGEIKITPSVMRVN